MSAPLTLAEHRPALGSPEASPSARDAGSAGRTFVRNGTFLLLAEGANRGARFLFLVILARHLGSGSYGGWAFALAYVTIFAILVEFGFATLTTREIARDPSSVSRYLTNLALAKIVLAGLGVALMTAALPLTRQTELRTLIYLLALGAFLNSFAQLFNAVFRAHNRMELETWSRLAQSVVLLAAPVPLVWLSAPSTIFVLVYASASAVSAAFSFLILVRMYGPLRFEVDLPFLRSALRVAWPFALSFFLTSIYYYLDSVMLGSMGQKVEVGWYNAAYLPVLGLITALAVLINAVFPLLARLYRESREQFQRTLDQYARLLVIIALLIAAAGWFLAGDVLTAVFGSEYAPGAAAFRVLLLTASVTYVGGIYYSSLFSCDRQRDYLWGVSLGVALNVGLNLILIPRYSLNGAAVSTLVGQFVTLAFIMQRSNALVRIDVGRHLARAIGPAAAVALVAFVIVQAGWWPLALGAIAIIYPAGLLLTGALRLEEIRGLLPHRALSPNEGTVLRPP